MPVELTIPKVGESIHEVQIGQWLKQEGQWVDKDENVVEIETEKASVEVPAPEAGYLAKILIESGEFASVGDVIARIDEGEEEKPSGKESKTDEPKQKKDDSAKEKKKLQPERQEKEKPDEADDEDRERTVADSGNGSSRSPHITPAARRALREHGVAVEDVQISGGRMRKEDVMQFVESRESDAAPEPQSPRRAEGPPIDAKPSPAGPREEETVPMSIIRRRIASRLVEAQQQAALLTTFNEIDMSEVIALRKQHQESFTKKHGVKLGFMSFFVKAVIEALKDCPEVNAEIRDDSIVYRNYYDIGIAVGGGKGLVVPILRSAERMSFAEIEKTIHEFAERAQQNKITPDEMTGGTFTISNGGVYGSLLSTPIVNPPQSGILGMHTIQDRPVAREGQVVIRPMMYVALTYDHRLVDGREAVAFLRRIGEVVGQPARMLIEA